MQFNITVFISRETIMYAKAIIILLILLVFAGCSIEGTRNKSVTLMREYDRPNFSSIAILPVNENGSFLELSSKIEISIQQQLQDKLTNTRIIDSSTVRNQLMAADLITSFTQWRSNYETTSIIDPRPLSIFAEATQGDYFILVSALHLGRERINIRDTGYNGGASGEHVWRTELKVAAELIHAFTGKVVWKGIGHAENINEPHTVNLFIIKYRGRNPSVQDFVPELVHVAIMGLVNQLSGSTE